MGKRDLNPQVGGTLCQEAHTQNKSGTHKRLFNIKVKVKLSGAHLEAFKWLMHLADGSISNFDIATKSNLDIKILNEAIAAMSQKDLLELLRS